MGAGLRCDPKLDIVYRYLGTTYRTHGAVLPDRGQVNFTITESAKYRFLANHEDFPNIVASKKELSGGKVLEQIFNVPVVEDSLQVKTLDRLQFKRVFLHDVVAGIQGLRPGVLSMKES